MKHRAFVLVPLLGLAACGPGALPEEPVPEPFIVFQRDFESYASWKRFDFDGEGEPGHGSGQRRVYVNRLPLAGSTSFPVGTVIVKELVGAQTFAMVKRGADYNAEGARGWEWFELQAWTDGKPIIVWRGIVPPSGEEYGGASGGTCNGCHGLASGNDSVLSPPLQLTLLAAP